MILLLLYPISFSLLLYANRKSLMSLYSMVLLLYLLSSICGIYIYQLQSKFAGMHIYVSAVIYHIIMLSILLFQYKKLNKFIRQDLLPVKDVSLINIFTLIIATLCIICDVNAIQNISYSFATIDVKEARTLLIENTGEFTMVDRLAYFGNKYALVSLALGFYYLIYKPQNKILIFILFLGSFSMFLPSFRVAGREYVIKYIFVLFIAYLLCRNQLSSQSKKSIKLYSLIISTLCIAYFLFISFLRFGDRNDYIEKVGDNSMFNALMAYFGQGFIIFSDFFDSFIYPVLPIGSIHFKFFSSGSTSAFNLNDSVYTNVYLNAFSTGLGDLLLDGGIVFATIIILLFVLIIRYVSSRRFNLFTFIYVLWLFDFIFSFLFFFNESFTGSRVLSLFVIFFFDFIDSGKTKIRRKIK